MGYEILYYFHDRLENGKYDTDQKKSIKKRVGDPFEDVCVDKCAGAIISQLARRDIWVVDVEVFEVTKKKVTFRETSGGVILKNKKYLMDGLTSIVSQEISEAPPVAIQPPTQLIPSTQLSNAPVVGHPHNRGVLKPIKWVIYQPSYKADDEEQHRKLKVLRLTIDKKYPVFAEQLQLSGVGLAYKTIDDIGRELLVCDEYFIPADTQLMMDRELRFSETPIKRDGNNLNWSGVIKNDDIPKLR